MSLESAINIVINLGVAIGTIAVAIAAIWGDRLTAWFNPPKARIALHNTKGKEEGGTVPGDRKICYHLKVINQTQWKTLQNCRVLLTEIQRKRSDGNFHSVPFPVPRQFVWSPAELSPIAVSVSKERIFDFGVLWFVHVAFRPSLYPQGGELNPDVDRNGAVRYRLEIVADNFPHHEGQLFEVAFDGVCSADLDEMSKHLRICEVPQ